MFGSKKASHPAKPRKGDAPYLSAVSSAQVVEGMPGANWALYLVFLVIVVAIGWSATAHVDEVTRADARVVPDGREQVIASLEGGLLSKLYVQEGQQVKAGQRLAQIDPARFESQQAEAQAKQLSLKASLARLLSEAYGRPLKFPPEVAAVPAVVEGETEAYLARKRSVDEAVAATQRSIELSMRELRVAESMSAQGLMSEMEVNRLRRQVNDLRTQIQERVNRARQEASTDLVRVRTELALLDEQLAGRQDVLRRTVLTSPVHGLVKNIRTATIGGVIGAGSPMMEIVPIGERMLIEVRIKPSEIGFVRVGQNAQVKLAAYDYATYGALQGKVEYISPDALGDTEKATADATYYRALVRTEPSEMKAHGKPLQIIPGMTGTVEMRTGDRTVLSFILRPMMKSREAFQEG
jgi:adhesin transport system membrane fusion protein